MIGSGISGLSAAWLLSQRHAVTLIEQNQRLGGHSNTVEVRASNGLIVPVDTGFIVSNTWTYPNFTALMAHLGVGMNSTKMTFSVSAEEGRFEYCGDNLATLLGPRTQWLSPRRWRLVADLVRFYKTAEMRAKTLPENMTLGEYLAAYGYSDVFINKHILPIAGAIWSSGPVDIAKFPFQAFVKFFANHRLFQLADRPDWQTVQDGSRTYIRRIMAQSNISVVTGDPVSTVRRDHLGVDVHCASGTHYRCDHVVVATHANQALKLLADPDKKERELLSVFRTSSNRAVLHRDAALMPTAKRFWSGWNYQTPICASDHVSVTYWMNALQKLKSPDQHFVTLNPLREPDPKTVDAEMVYHHPIFTPETFVAQKSLWTLQGKRHTWFAGAWFGAGFHEDGLQAGLAVAEQLGGVVRPWSIPDQSGRISILPAGAAEVQQPFAEAAE